MLLDYHRLSDAIRVCADGEGAAEGGGGMILCLFGKYRTYLLFYVYLTMSK